ncbi:MAG: hypothetical protein JO033_04525 [Acidobacteriaceae bacterium]|nr:hypothetical protein [Acidobacteriaceae bacterium]
MDEVLRSDAATIRAISEAQAGYGFNRSLAERDLFRGLGFHLGSEMLADREFSALDAHLRSHPPELVHFLSSKEISISGRRCRAYHWIKTNTTAEAEHSDAGANAVALALRYYVGLHNKSEIEQFIFNGFAEFAAVQTRFTDSLTG